MFKVRFYLIIIMIICLSLVAGCNGEQAEVDGEKEVYELSLAHFFPATHPIEAQLVKDWIEAVEEATDGRVKITSYPQETLSKADEIYEGVVSGIADLGLSFFSYNRGRFPLLEAFELPGIIYETSSAASMTAWEGIKQLDLEEVQDTKLMFVLATGPGDLFTTAPVRSMEDLQGMKIRAMGLTVETLNLLGAVPDAMSQAEAYEALSRGLVQGNLAPIEVLQGWNHGEVTDYITMTPFLYNALCFLTMNMETWNSLPADLQEAILEVNEKIHGELARGLWDEQNEAALEWAVTEMGMEVINLSPDEAARWIEAVTPLQEDFVIRMENQGLDGAAVLETVKRLAEEYGEL